MRVGLLLFSLMVHIKYFRSDLDLEGERRGLITLVRRLFD